ncbi:hypothetical protein AGMMS49587_08230 [Spirochaetia bacterium]|nr:hypothetical protein AGMMS49587_08230 [Spirochaetia bacterium]
MGKKSWVFIGLMFLMLGFSLPAQSNVSVPLTNEIYYVLEIAQMKGLLLPLPKVKPYSKKQILEAIDAIFEADTGGKLSVLERNILNREARTYRREEERGLNWRTGTYNFKFSRSARRSGREIPFAGDIGVGAQMGFSGGLFANGEKPVGGTDNMFSVYTTGDIGEHFSYGFTFLGHLTLARRTEYTDAYPNYYDGFPGGDEDSGYIFRKVTTYGQPLAYFPYTYEKYWDGAVFYPSDLSAESAFRQWPQKFAMAPMLLGELSGGFFNDMITWRFGRLRHEWGAMSEGRSLIFNGAAQPFMAIEATFNPVYWFSFSALTGSLEYFKNQDSIKKAAWAEQNNFSIEILEFNIKNRFHFDVGSTAVWPKRFDLGYIFPIKNNFLYQDTLGDFDNMSFFLDMAYQYPGYGKAWVSLFVDEISLGEALKHPSSLFELDRMMYVAQVGIKAIIPKLPFSSITLNYTKVEPYAYTHNRVFVPWYNNTYDGDPVPMEQAYTNNGESIGYYLPPNSDELLIRFDTMPALNTLAFFQYQMIRHGADHGPHSVDGSSFLSELDPDGRSSNPVLRKFFLRDGAYQWQHIFMIGAEHTFAKWRIPLRVFAKTGVVYSFYTDINGPANSGSASDYKVIDTPSYPKSTEFILTLGVRIYM